MRRLLEEPLTRVSDGPAWSSSLRSTKGTLPFFSLSYLLSLCFSLSLHPFFLIPPLFFLICLWRFLSSSHKLSSSPYFLSSCLPLPLSPLIHRSRRSSFSLSVSPSASSTEAGGTSLLVGLREASSSVRRPEAEPHSGSQDSHRTGCQHCPKR